MFDIYKNRMAARGRNMSDMLRMQSNMVIEQTWNRDPNYRQVYVVKVDSGLPEVTAENELIDCKFNVKTYENITSDEPSYGCSLGMAKKNVIQKLLLEVIFIWRMKIMNGHGGCLLI